MLFEKHFTLKKYQFSVDGEEFAQGYLLSEDSPEGEKVFHMGSLHCDGELPVPEETFLEAVIDDGGFSDGRLMLRGGRFLISLLGDTSTPIQRESPRSFLRRCKG